MHVAPRLRLASLFAVGILGLVARPAHAQQGPTAQGFALDRFDPAESGSDWFALDSLDLRGSIRPSVGLTLELGHNPLVAYNPDGTVANAIVANQLFGHLGASVVLADRLRLGLNVPVALYQAGSDEQVYGSTFQAPTKTSLGDIRVGADLRLFGNIHDPATLAIGAQVYLPSGSQPQFAGDGAVRVAPHVLLAGDLGPITYAARVAFDYRANQPAFGASDGAFLLGNELQTGLAVGVRALDDALTIGPEIYGSTVLNGSGNFLSKATSPLELLGSVHYHLGDFLLGAGAGPGLTRGVGSPQFRALFTFSWSPAYEKPDLDHDGIEDEVDACPDVPGVHSDDPTLNGCPPDRDRDGVPDAQDACPTVKGVKTSNPATNGCPPPPPDRDHDGILDAQDACPDVKGVKTNDRTTNGCPPPPPDRDHDGIVDAKDACPDVKGIKTSDPKTNGCPPPPDRDRDGVPDAKDACPDLPGVRSSDPKTNGCPNKDTDADGLPDYLDNCPTEKGPKSNQGCPVKKKQLVVITRQKIEIKDKVFFATGKATIKKQSFRLLNQVADVIKSHSDIPTIVIEGHTDDRGGAALNRKLSQARAESVRAYLIKKGVEPGHLVAKGYGPDRPLESNKTSKGRAKNRRVEFTIAGHEESSTSHELELAPLSK